MPGLIGLGDGVSVNESNRTVVSTSYDVYDEDGRLVGYCTAISRTDTRTVTKVRHLSSSDAGRVIEQVPAPEDVTIDVTGYALYNTPDLTGDVPHYSLAARLTKGMGANVGGGVYLFKSINSQRIPVTIRQEEVHPVTGAVDLVYYHGCMITNYTKPQNLGTTTVAETVKMQVAWVDSLPSAAPQPGVIVGASTT